MHDSEQLAMNRLFVTAFLLGACSSPTSSVPSGPTYPLDATVSVEAATTLSPEPTPRYLEQEASAPTASVPQDAGINEAPMITLEWSGPIAPGYEGNTCVILGATATTEKWLTAWHATLELLHHANLWFVPPDTAVDPNSVAAWCNAPAGPQKAFIFDASQPDLRAAVPTGGSIRIPANSIWRIDLHQLNTSSDPGTAVFHLELALQDARRGLEVFPGALGTQHISVPPASTKTLTWTCPIPADATILWMSSHSHSHTTLLTASANGAEVYRSTAWSEPAQEAFLPPLSTKSVSWSSTIVNDGTTTLTCGPSRDNNEMSGIYLMTLGERIWCTQ
jgi:hypothetical protein